MRLFALLYLLILCAATPAAAAQSPLEIDFDFPYGKDTFLGIRMYEKGVVGSISKFSVHDFPVRGKIVVRNAGGVAVENAKLEFTLEEPLVFETQQAPPSGKWDGPRRLVWEIPRLEPGAAADVLVHVIPPKAETLAEGETPLRLFYSGGGIKGEIPFRLRNPQNKWLPYLVIFNGSAVLALLLLFGGYRKLFARYTTAELVSLAILISFYVACSVVSQILRAFGAPSTVLHLAWSFYFFSFLLTAVRLVPKRGAALLFIYGGTLVSGLMLWGLSPIFILTYTICSGVAFEIWFRLTGFGKNLFSAVGAAVVFFVYPVSFFWFFIAPVLYHYFYHWWYIAFWLVLDIGVYVPAAALGWWFTNRLVKAVR